MCGGGGAMTDDLNSRQEQAAVQVHEAIVPSEETHRLLVLSLVLSLLSTLLALFVTIKSRRETKATNKKEKREQKNIKKELQEIHKEIALLKESQGHI
jgi:Na+/melibiose symporter-like transporter